MTQSEIAKELQVRLRTIQSVEAAECPRLYELAIEGLARRRGNRAQYGEQAERLRFAMGDW
jgi:hypothetical protein